MKRRKNSVLSEVNRLHPVMKEVSLKEKAKSKQNRKVESNESNEGTDLTKLKLK